MRRVFRTYLGFALVLLLLLTSQSMAVARGARGAVGLTELCTGSGPVMVQVDDTGAPVGPPHFCPDYALTLLVDASAPQSLADPVWLQARLTGCFVPVVAETRVLTRACARAPPVGL